MTGQKRAWTPGPWRLDPDPFQTVIVDGNGHPIASTINSQQGWESPNPLADAELITLAAEMAEAMLGVSDCSCHGPLLDWEAGTFKIGKQEHGCYPDRDDCPHMQYLFELAGKLRQIGDAS